MLKFNFLGKGLRIVSPPHFLNDFSKKMLLMLYSINWPNFIAWFPLLLEILGNMCIAIICFSIYDVINFEINHAFLIKPFSTWPKRQDKNLNIWERKEFLRWNEKYVSSFLKGSQLPKIVSDLTDITGLF